MRRILYAAASASFALAALVPASARAAVIDEIAVERGDAGPRVRVRLTGPVHYIRDYASGNGELVNVQLEALAPLAPGAAPFPDEVKRFPGEGSIPPFTVRVSLDPRCEPVPNPVCILIQYERAVRSRVRLGEDRRSLLLDFPTATDEKRRAPSANKTN
ncbi:MAG TPA: hypothetical protein VFK92_00095 [Burkholderiales bacterium]|nr:hypothetical protein [Burkholderiales bacterium]